jgi:sugar (pentulose or hexulose) kinase
MAGIILSVDIGTSSLKAAFINLDGKLLAFSRMPYTKDGENSLPCAGAWERAFVLTLEALHAQAPGLVIDAVCVSGNGPTLVPVTPDADAMPPLYWHDGRTVQSPPMPQQIAPLSFFLPRAAWLKTNAAPLYEKTRFFISSHEWLAFRLGAEPLTVLPSMAYEPYYWDEQQCDLFGLDRSKFPPFIKMGSIMGHVSKDAASFLSSSSGSCLKSGTPIIAGGPDFITALIGTGVRKPGDVCDRAGSSEGINVCAVSPVKGEGLRLLPHVEEGLWNIGIVINSSGRLFELYKSNAGFENISNEELLAELIPSTADTGIFIQQRPVPDSRSPIDLGRAVLCAIGFAVRSALETLAAYGFPVEIMRVSGGQAKNSRWNQLKADITGVSLMIPEINDGELAGNAVLAAVALENSVFEHTVNRMIRFRELYEPGSASAAFWEQSYSNFTGGAAGK